MWGMCTCMGLGSGVGLARAHSVGGRDWDAVWRQVPHKPAGWWGMPICEF